MELNTIYNEDCLLTMAKMPDDFIDLTVTSPPYDCYSKDTDVLTYYGWKNISCITTNDKIFTLNPETKQVYWEDCIRTCEYDFNGEMINFKNQNIDILVTPNHRMYVEGMDGKPSRERIPFKKKELLKSSFFKEARNVKTADRLRMNGFKWSGEDKQYFLLPEVKCLYNKQNKIFEAKKISMLWWVRFLGIFLAEGGCRGTKNGKKDRYNINIKQKDKKNVDTIREILSNIGFKFCEYMGKTGITCFEINNRQLWNYLFKLGDSYGKYVPQEIKDLSINYLEEFFYYYLLGDGFNNDKNNDNLFERFDGFSSVSRRLRDDFIEISIKLGRISKEIKRGYVLFYDRGVFIKYRKKYINYNGKVYCIEVKNNNIILVRRNNKIIFCGNSLREYKGYSFDFERIAKELYRVTKEGGVVVWVVGDATVDGSETGTSFKQGLYFKEIGFNLHDTMIYAKNNPIPCQHNRYQPCFEYMFILSKGQPKTFNPLREKCTTFGKTRMTGQRDKEGNITNSSSSKTTREFRYRHNIFYYSLGGGLGNHPAAFPEELAGDQIISWSNEGDLIYDCFAGSGTTLKMAKLNKRNYIGSEISPEYCEIIKQRLAN